MVEDNKKPKWEKPKLIVWVRGGRQEGVLQDCKNQAEGSGPNDGYYTCWNTYCGECKSYAPGS